MSTTFMDDAAAGDCLFAGPEWDFPLLDRIVDTIEPIAYGEFGLETYPIRLEVITAEQMLDAYASVGMPLMYKHWSFGKHFAQQELFYRKGMRGLAYEIVINSSPSIAYLMEENTATMQTLVIAHAAFGHNHFFRNNYLFKEWTDAEGILDYLAFAKEYIARCVEKHGVRAVERLLDAAHALQPNGVDRYPRKGRPTDKQRLAREIARAEERQRSYDDLFERTVPHAADAARHAAHAPLKGEIPEDAFPEENILRFLEKYAPRLKPWQREVLRIVRHIGQYFYPQGQTKVMNEGCATYVHYRIMRRLLEAGRISEGNYLEFLQSHTNVVFQPMFDNPYFTGFNPYALGFAMMQDIERICTGVALDGTPCTDEQRAEDRAWFPAIAGNGDPWGTLRDAWANYRDESFIRQFLSPKLIRDFRLFSIEIEAGADELPVLSIADDAGYKAVRNALADQYDPGLQAFDIQVAKADLADDRELVLEHHIARDTQLDADSTESVLQHLANLWGYPVSLYNDRNETMEICWAAEPDGGCLVSDVP